MPISLLFNSKRIPGAVVVTDPEERFVHAVIIKISKGEHVGKRKIASIGVVRPNAVADALHEEIKKIPLGTYDEVKEAVLKLAERHNACPSTSHPFDQTHTFCNV